MNRFAAALVIVFAASPAWAAGLVIDTTPAWTGGGVATLGGNGVSAYGQSFVAPASAPVLDSFTFFIDEFNVEPSVSFRGYVAPWNESDRMVTGPLLFTSNVIASTNNRGADGWEEVTLLTDNLLLQPGNAYIAFLGTFGLFESLEHELKAGLAQVDAYSGGSFYYFGDNATYAELESVFIKEWLVLGGGESHKDTAFRTTFSVPEPPTVATAAIGLAGLAIATWRRRKTIAT